MPVLSQDLKTFTTACARGDPEARTAFQERYSALIYTFPVRIFGLPEDETGDFYLYVFEKEGPKRHAVRNVPLLLRA